MAFRKGTRVVIMEGLYKDQFATVVRKYNAREWMVKRDGRMSPDFYTTNQIRRIEG